MKLLKLYNFSKEVNLEETALTTLIIENNISFRNFLSYCYNEFEGKYPFFIIEHDGNVQNNDKVAFNISNPFNLDLNSKKNLNALYKMLKKRYYSELEEDVFSIKEKITGIAKKISLDFDVELEFAEEIPLDDLFKIVNLRFEDSIDNNFIIKFIKFIKIISELQNIYFFVFPFMHQYFDRNEISTILKELHYFGISFLAVECNNNFIHLEKEELFILDNDLCLID